MNDQAAAPLFLCYGSVAPHQLTQLGATVTKSLKSVVGRQVFVVPNAKNADIAERDALRALDMGASSVAIIRKAPHGAPDVAEYILDANGRASLEAIVACAQPIGPAAPKNVDTPTHFLMVRTMSDVKPEALEWLTLNGCDNRYAIGKVTLIGGDPGLGKSLMCTSDEAAVTKGGGRAVVFSAEDDAGDTLRPRYDVAGADVTRIIHVDGVGRTQTDGSTQRQAFNLERDIPALRALLAQNKEVIFVRIDPVTAYLGKTDSHKNAEVRALLAQLEEIAREFRVAIVVVTHLNKNTNGPALYRFVGSLAFVAACRLAFVVARDPDNAERRLVIPAKANITADQLGYAFTVEETWHEGIRQNVARVVWEPDPVTITLDSMAQGDTSQRRHERERVKDFLKRELAGGPVPSKTLTERAAAENISERTLFRAKEELKIPARKLAGAWHWATPEDWK